jgi:hypothetical protein
MNVMNRKMFKKARPARSALNQAGGIMDSSPELMQTVQNYPVPGVQNFANGSNVRIPGLGDSPTANARRIRELQKSRDFGADFRYGANKLGGYLYSPFRYAGGVANDFAGGIASILGMDDVATKLDADADAQRKRAFELSPFYGREEGIVGTGLITENNPYYDSLFTSKPVTSDDVENTGLSMTPTSSVASSSKFDASLPFGGMLNAEELAKRQARFDAQDDERALNIFENRGRQLLPDPDEKAFANKAIEDKAALLNRERALYGPSVDPSGMNDYLAKIQAETEAEKFERLRRTAAPATKEAIATEEARLKKIKDDETAFANDLTAFGGSGSPISSAEEIKKQVQSTVISGSPQEKQKDLKQLMAEFTDNAPKYEGMNKGLAIAKIGFAIAAGDSPNAMTNIARGLSQGADEFIKDKANRDAFDRQLKLTALQYGLGEQSKIDTQRRADDRNIFDFVATEDGSFKGEEFKKGQNIRVSMTDIMANGGKLPAELQNQELYLKNVAAVNDRNKLVIEAADDLRKEKIITDTASKDFTTRYASSASKFKSAERGVTYLERIIGSVAEGEVTGGEAAFKDLFRKGGAFFGIGALQGKEFESLEDAKTAMSIALQPLIKVTLGETQSANSISNRDVEFLIKAVYGDDALSKSSFSLATTSTKAMITRLKGAMQSMRDAQKGNLNDMKVIEDQLVSRILPGQGEGSGMTIIRSTQKDIAPYLPGGEITANTMGRFQVRDDGTYDIVYD